MSVPLENRVRETREARGLSQIELGEAANLSRQSVGAIEAGRATPSVDVALRLAAVLECRVEDLFGARPAEPKLTAELAESADLAPPPSLESRVVLARLAGRWVAHRLHGEGLRRSADGITTTTKGKACEVTLLRPKAALEDNVVLMGCAAGLGLLADRVEASGRGGRYAFLARSSTAALEALSRKRIHVAGVHLVDGKTGESNVRDVRRLVKQAVSLITLARWEVGLVVHAGNPKGLRAVADLARPGVSFVPREPGSGARRLFERELHASGTPLELCTLTSVVGGHLEVARAVALGVADAGIASRDSALEAGLGFLPLTEERYDLVVPSEGLGDARIARLFDALCSSGFRKELATLGYDVRSCGDRVAELPAA